ncbi:MAG: response regulator transcription factor [Methylococcaceae bacterium]|nr:response regulator transcription factor [Methylococcaceae bacterium]
MKILVIEDDEDKTKKLEEFICAEFPSASMQFAKSLNSGLKALIAERNDLDLILLDMSMPIFDISQQEPSGGAPENFAGSELLAQMCLRSINVPVIVVTMFDSFGAAPNQKSLEQLVAELKECYSPPFKGLVYYNSIQEGWRSALKQLINESINGRKI